MGGCGMTLYPYFLSPSLLISFSPPLSPSLTCCTIRSVLLCAKKLHMKVHIILNCTKLFRTRLGFTHITQRSPDADKRARMHILTRWPLAGSVLSYLQDTARGQSGSTATGSSSTNDSSCLPLALIWFVCIPSTHVNVTFHLWRPAEETGFSCFLYWQTYFLLF